MNKSAIYDKIRRNAIIRECLLITDNGLVYDMDKNRWLKQSKSRKGYMSVSCKGKAYRVHRLVCEAFIPNPENKPQVNHKNGIKDDNRLINLEWCTNSENELHAFRQLGRKGFNKSHEKYSKPIQATNLITGEQKIYDSRNAAARGLGIQSNAIGEVANGRRKKYKEYTFEYLKAC